MPAEDIQPDTSAPIVTNSPLDRVIGMLMERTEALRELHRQTRENNKIIFDAITEMKVLMGRVVDRMDRHEGNDAEAFAKVATQQSDVLKEIKSLTEALSASTQGEAVKDARFTAGYRVIIAIGGFVLFVASVVSTVWNIVHTMGAKPH